MIYTVKTSSGTRTVRGTDALSVARTQFGRAVQSVRPEGKGWFAAVVNYGDAVEGVVGRVRPVAR